MKGNYTEYEKLAVELINNHAGFLPGQEKERILHTQFALAAVYDQGYHQSTKDKETKSSNSSKKLLKPFME